MADLIALHWAPDEITAASAGKGRDVRAASLGGPPSGDPAAVGRWLKGELAARRIQAKRAVVVLPRSAAVFRKLTLPDIPDDELPDLVRMQAATKSPTPLDRLRLDFVPLPRRGETRDVLLATTAAKTADETLAAVRAAGLEPAGLSLAPYGTAARVIADDAPTLIIAVRELSVEISLCRESAVILSHAAELPGDSVEEDRRWLPGEVSRALVAADHLAAATGVTRVVLLGPTGLLRPLVDVFAERYGAHIELLDDAAKLDAPSADANVAPAALAAAAGYLGQSGIPNVDFLNPRKRIEKPDRRRLRAGLVAGGVAAAAAVAYFMSWSTRVDLEGEAADLRTELVALQDALKRGEPTRDAHDKVDAWLADRADWVDQLATVDAALPGTESAYLTGLTFDSWNQRGGSNRDAPLGAIKGNVVARDGSVANGIHDALAAAGFQVNVKPVSESSRDPQYRKQFALDLTIPRPKPPATSQDSAPGTTVAAARRPS